MRTKQKLAQTRAGQTRGLGSRSRRHRPPRERWEEARGGRRPRPTMEDPSPDDAGQKTVRRSRRAGRDEGGSRTLRRSAGGCTKRLGAAGTRGTMWKTASASPPSGGRPRLVADHTHKEPCTKIATQNKRRALATPRVAARPPPLATPTPSATPKRRPAA